MWIGEGSSTVFIRYSADNLDAYLLELGIIDHDARSEAVNSHFRYMRRRIANCDSRHAPYGATKITFVGL